MMDWSDYKKNEEDGFWKTVGIGALNVACLAMIVVVGLLAWAVICIPD
jgi:hypothetical protein